MQAYGLSPGGWSSSAPLFLGVLRPVGVGSQNFTSRSLVRRGRIQAFARLGPPSKYTDLKPVWGHAVKPWSKAALSGLDLGGTTVSTETVGTATSCVLEVSTAECLLNSLLVVQAISGTCPASDCKGSWSGTPDQRYKGVWPGHRTQVCPGQFRRPSEYQAQALGLKPTNE